MYFLQLNDIDATGVNFKPIGTSTTPAYLHYDGQLKTIRNLSITRADGFVGLFGKITSGALKNIKIDAVKIVTTVNGNAYAGVLAGETGAPVFNCHVYNSEVTALTGDYVGGLVGNSTNTVEQCYVWTYSKGRNVVGGIAGSLVGGTISASFSTGEFTASNIVCGGIVGEMAEDAVVRNCYATAASVTKAKNNAGGIAARKGAGSSLIEYCYTVGTTELSAVNVPNVLGAISADAGITQSRN